MRCGIDSMREPTFQPEGEVKIKIQLNQNL